MEINFKEAALSDRAEFERIMQSSDKRFCEYTFGNLICWGNRGGVKIAFTENGFVMGNPEKSRFVFPVGKDAKDIAEVLIKTYPKAVFSALSEDDTNILSGDFEITETPEKFDYIYESEKLRTLSGKKLAAKRNHINAFLADGVWHTREITEENIGDLLDFNKKWCKNICENDSSLQSEMCAVTIGLENFEALGYKGLVLYKNGKICGYSYGEPVNGDTFCVHVEKADSDVRGAYQMINREFVRAYCEDFAYINREDDAGDEGLCRAKLSYYPTQIGKKFRAVCKK